jgi:hypothetical protein
VSEAEFYWTLAEPPEAKRIEVGSAPGMFSIHMERAFAPRGFPLLLTENDLDILHGMAAAWTDVSVPPYVILAMNIKKYKKIIVYRKQGDE